MDSLLPLPQQGMVWGEKVPFATRSRTAVLPRRTISPRGGSCAPLRLCSCCCNNARHAYHYCSRTTKTHSPPMRRSLEETSLILQWKSKAHSPRLSSWGEMWLGGAIAEERLSSRFQPRRATTVHTYETSLQGRQDPRERGWAREALGHTPNRVGEGSVL